MQHVLFLTLPWPNRWQLDIIAQDRMLFPCSDTSAFVFSTQTPTEEKIAAAAEAATSHVVYGEPEPQTQLDIDAEIQAEIDDDPEADNDVVN